MAKIIVLGAMKGGVGKSVSTFNLAYSLAELRKKVLAVDFDSQANLTTYMGVEDVAAVPVTIGPASIFALVSCITAVITMIDR